LTGALPAVFLGLGTGLLAMRAVNAWSIAAGAWFAGAKRA